MCQKIRPQAVHSLRKPFITFLDLRNSTGAEGCKLLHVQAEVGLLDGVAAYKVL